MKLCLVSEVILRAPSHGVSYLTSESGISSAGVGGVSTKPGGGVIADLTSGTVVAARPNLPLQDAPSDEIWGVILRPAGEAEARDPTARK